MNQQNRMAGIVKKVDDVGITLSMESGGEMTVPKNFGESPKEGDVLMVEHSSGAPVLYSMPPVSRVGTIKRYMNFYAIEKEGNVPDLKPRDKNLSADAAPDTPIAPFSPFSFADTPAGARTLAAGNGNMCFAGPTSAGIVTSCESKMIVRDDGTAEIVTPHFRGMLGKTIVVSSLHDNLAIEIDISSDESSGGVYDINSIKNRIANLIVGKDGPAISYEEAFAKSIDGSNLQPFYNLFGLQLAEVLLTFKWERLKYHGSEKVLNEVFGEIAMLASAYTYCQDCYGEDVIGEMEYFLSPGMDNSDGVYINFPSCESDVYDTVMGVNAYINGDMYEVYALNMTLKDGTTIEYSKKKRIYALSHGIMAKGSWNSAKKHALYSDDFHANVDAIAIPDLTISSNALTYCDNRIGMPSITWEGDFNLNVLGDASISATGANTIYGGRNAVIGGGTRGIYVDNTGSSAITL